MASEGKQTANANQSGTAAAVEWAALSRPLRECGEIASQRLAGMLSDSLMQAADQLFIQGIQALTLAERETWLDAADFARVRRHSLVYDFRMRFEQRYRRACQHKPSLVTGYLIDFDVSQLRVVKHDLLDDALDPGKITEAIRNVSGGTLHTLAKGFGRLMAVQGLNPNDIPLAPKLIEAAVSDAVRDQPWRHEAKLRLVRCLRKFLPAQVSLLYHDLAAHLNSGDTAEWIVPEEEADPFAPLDGETEDILLQDPLFVPRPMPVVATTEAGPESVMAGETLASASTEARDEMVAPTSADAPELPGQDEVDGALLLPPEPEPAPPESSSLSVAANRAEVQATAPVMPPQTVAPPGPDLPATLLGGLESGNWMEFREQDGSTRDLKLAWISPRRSLFLLTDRHGARARSLGAEEFVTLLLQGWARVIQPPHESSSPDCANPGQHFKKSA